MQELGSDRYSSGREWLYSVICQDWEEWPQGDSEGSDIEKEDSDGHVPRADLPLSEELSGTKSLCLILHKAEIPGMRLQSPENTGLAGSIVEIVLE